MPFISVTYTFSNGAASDATQVNQNFSDVINGTSDGTKNLNVSAVTTGGTLTTNGNVILGQSTSNTLTFNGSVASNIPVQTNTTYDLGASTLGFKSIYLGGGGALTTRILGGTLSGSSQTFTLPTTTGTSGYVMQTDGTGVLSFVPGRSQYTVVSKTAIYSIATSDEIVLGNTDTGAFALTLPTAIGVTGKTYVIKYTGTGYANALTVNTTSSQTIDGQTTTTLNTPNESIRVMSDGANWQLLNRQYDSSWQSYTPTFTGLGTCTGVNVQWRRNGGSMDINFSFTTGTVSGTQATLTLPNSLTVGSAITNTTQVGSWARGGTGAQYLTVVVANGGVSTVILSSQSTGAASLVPVNANLEVNSSEIVGGVVTGLPITGWKAWV